MTSTREPGPGVDIFGQPVVDPTKNVLDLVASAILRLDDLRTLTAKHAEEMAVQREEHAKELRVLEAQRIDAIRAVDVAASQQATKDAEVRATALAGQVQAAAEAQRNQVAAAAQAAATALGAALVPIQERLAELTRLQYEQAGQKQQTTESRLNVGTIIGIAGVLVALATVIVILVVNSNRNSVTPSNVPSVVCTATYHPTPCP